MEFYVHLEGSAPHEEGGVGANSPVEAAKEFLRECRFSGISLSNPLILSLIVYLGERDEKGYLIGEPMGFYMEVFLDEDGLTDLDKEIRCLVGPFEECFPTACFGMGYLPWRGNRHGSGIGDVVGGQICVADNGERSFWTTWTVPQEHRDTFGARLRAIGLKDLPPGGYHLLDMLYEEVAHGLNPTE